VNEPRYIVTEIVGFMEFSSGGGRANAGMSCHVLDTAWNHRLVATYRTESYGRAPIPQNVKRGYVRSKAREHADRLNAS
jgi:hypothetical protein